LDEADESATDSVNLLRGPARGPSLFSDTCAASGDGPRFRFVEWDSFSDETLIMDVLLDIRGMTSRILGILEGDEEEDSEEDA
jgi:hypothetical protein